MRISDWSSDVCSSDLLFIGDRSSLNRWVLWEASLTHLAEEDGGRSSRPTCSSKAPIRASPLGQSVQWNSSLRLQSAPLSSCLSAPKLSQSPRSDYCWAALLPHLLERSSPSIRSEERRVGKECVSTFRSRLS